MKFTNTIFNSILRQPHVASLGDFHLVGYDFEFLLLDDWQKKILPGFERKRQFVVKLLADGRLLVYENDLVHVGYQEGIPRRRFFDVLHPYQL